MAASFFNSTNLSGNDLKDAIARAAKLDEAVLLLYVNTRGRYSPSQVFNLWQKAGRKEPITSIRRSITNLTNAKHLTKTSDKRVGLYDAEEYIWALNFTKYPSSVKAEQAKMF